MISPVRPWFKRQGFLFFGVFLRSHVVITFNYTRCDWDSDRYNQVIKILQDLVISAVIKSIQFWERLSLKRFRKQRLASIFLLSLTIQSLKAWFYEASRAQWQSPSDIKRLYRNASIIANNRVVFNIKGNDYRIIT